ncbi:MAG: TIGR01777 family oxidoreductase [Thermoanaerobaculia bacterium]
MRVVVAGGTGFIGTRLSARLIADGHEVIVLTRNAQKSRDHIHPRVRVASWAEGASWEGLVDGAGAIVNLAGESIAQRWTAKSKAKILDSRLTAVQRLHDAVSHAELKPAVLVNASAVGYYGPHGDEELTEESRPGADFLAETCLKWEQAARTLEELGLRVVRVRIGLVLGEEGGALAKMLPPFRLGAGGPLGSGQQWMSWIHVDDLVDLILWAIKTPTVTGVVNATAPHPVQMKEFATTLGKVLHRPAFAPVPRIALKLLLGEMATMVLEGQRVLPKKTEALGFRFKHPLLEEALTDTL